MGSAARRQPTRLPPAPNQLRSCDKSCDQIGYETPETTKPSYFYEGFVLYGAGTRSRTRDLLITSQLLYQLSYTGVLGRRLYRLRWFCKPLNSDYFCAGVRPAPQMHLRGWPK